MLAQPLTVLQEDLVSIAALPACRDQVSECCESLLFSSPDPQKKHGYSPKNFLQTSSKRMKNYLLRNSKVLGKLSLWREAWSRVTTMCRATPSPPGCHHQCTPHYVTLRISSVQTCFVCILFPRHDLYSC